MKNSSKKSKAKKIILIILAIGIIGVCSILLAMAINGRAEENDCFDDQIERMQQLEILYDSAEAQKVDEQSFCEFSLDDLSEYQLNELQMVASHNSYKRYQPTVGRFISSVFYPLAGVDSEIMQYEHKSPTDQLNMGVRSFEWDMYQYSGSYDGFIIQHEPFIDSRSWIPNVKLAFEEVLMWSNYNKGHMPLIIMLEFGDTAFYDSQKADVLTCEKVLEVEKIITEVLGDKLFTPTQMLGDYENLAQMRDENGYPTLDRLQDKIIVLFQESEATRNYAADVDFKDQQIFAMLDSEDSCFMVTNEMHLFPENYENAKEKNYIIRTTLSPWTTQSEDVENLVFDSKAHILSTDYMYENMGYEVPRIEDKFMMGVIK